MKTIIAKYGSGLQNQFTFNSHKHPALAKALNQLRDNPEVRFNAIVAPVLEKALRVARPDLFLDNGPTAPVPAKSSVARKGT